MFDFLPLHSWYKANILRQDISADSTNVLYFEPMTGENRDRDLERTNQRGAFHCLRAPQIVVKRLVMWCLHDRWSLFELVIKLIDVGTEDSRSSVKQICNVAVKLSLRE